MYIRFGAAIEINWSLFLKHLHCRPMKYFIINLMTIGGTFDVMVIVVEIGISD